MGLRCQGWLGCMQRVLPPQKTVYREKLKHLPLAVTQKKPGEKVRLSCCLEPIDTACGNYSVY